MDAELQEDTKSPNIAYPFVPEVMNSYNELVEQFHNGQEEIPDPQDNLIWRDDMKFLFHLTRVFRFYVTYNRFPKVKFHKIPNISNARWNSRAILALLAFILLPDRRNDLFKICNFIANDWSNFWFTNQLYNPNDFNNLLRSVENYPKAQNTIKNFWNKDPSFLQILRSNQCAERAIKFMQELHATCKTVEKLRLKFILNNHGCF